VSDSDLTTLEWTGYVNAHIKDANGVYRFASHEYEALLAEWMRGAAFFTGAGPHGERVTVKLALVEGVVRWTPDACASAEGDGAENRARDRRRRLVEGEA
jgi:hypothetical protein